MRKIAFILILLLLFGCIEQSEVLFPEKAKLKEQVNADSDGDGLVDISSYKFEQLQMKGNITLSKVMIVKAVGESTTAVINVTRVNFSNSEIQEIKELLENFNSSRETVVRGMPAESTCKRTLGIDRFECYDRDSCFKACYTPICSRVAQSAGFQFLDSVRAYADSTKSLDNELQSSYRLLETVQKTQSANKTEELLNALFSMKTEIKVISDNELFNENVYSVCDKIPFDVNSLNFAIEKVASKLGVDVTQGKASKYEITTYLILVPPNATGFIANEIKISERVPEDIAASIDNITEVDPKYSEVPQEKPLILTWRFTDLGSGENQTKFILYRVTTQKEISREFVEKNIFYPQVSVKRVDPTQVPVVKELLGITTGMLIFLTGIFGIYAALGIFIAGVIVFVTRVFWNFVILILKGVGIIKERKDWKEALYQWAGYGRSNNLTYVLIAVVFLAIAFYMLYLTPAKSVKLDEITVYGLGSFVSQDPLKGIGSVVLSLGMLSLYFVAEDLGKGLVLGKRYYIRPIDVLKARNNKLMVRIETLKELVNSCEILGIDISTEGEVLELIDLKEIEELLKTEENLHEAKGAIDRTVALVEHSINGLEEKKEILENWPIWNKHIRAELEAKGVVNIEEIDEIPQKWRRWAMSRFLEDNVKEVMLKGKSELAKVVHEVKNKPELITVLEELVQTNKIEACAIVGRDGFVVSAKIANEMKNVAGAMSARMFRCAEMVSNELHSGKVNRVISESSGGRMVIVGTEKIILICLVKPEVDIGFVLLKMEEAIKKILEIV